MEEADKDKVGRETNKNEENEENENEEEPDAEQMNQQLQHLTQMIAEVDVDGDNMISFEEFRTAMKEDLENTGFSADSFQLGGNIRD